MENISKNEYLKAKRNDIVFYAKPNKYSKNREMVSVKILRFIEWSTDDKPIFKSAVIKKEHIIERYTEEEFRKLHPEYFI